MLLWGVQSVVFACNKCKIGMRKRKKRAKKRSVVQKIVYT